MKWLRGLNEDARKLLDVMPGESKCLINNVSKKVSTWLKDAKQVRDSVTLL